MTTPEERAEADSFVRFQATVEAVQAAPFTGDLSLDMLLHLLPADVRQAVEALSIPHWFGEAAVQEVARMAETDADGLAERLIQLPFVRKHERGLTYHDVARTKIRDVLQSQDAERVRSICRGLAPLYPAPGKDPSLQESEVWAEHLYLRLAYDEEAALEEITSIFDGVRRDRAHVIAQLLVSRIGEQLPLLKDQGVSLYHYFRGLAAFDQRDFEAAARSLAEVNEDSVPGRIRAHIELYQGWILEETGELELAFAHYGDVLARSTELGIDDGADGMLARLHQRSSRAALTLGRLGEAESHVRRSLALNTAQEDIYGLALNQSLLGQIHRHLGDATAARKEFLRALELLQEAERPYQVSEVFLHLGQVHRDMHEYDEAEKAFREAIDLKVDAGDHYGLAFAYAELGRLKLLRQESEAALQWYQTSLKLLRQFQDKSRMAAVQQNMAIIHASAARHEDAVRWQRAALDDLPARSESHDAMTRQLRRMESRLERSRRSWFGRNWRKATAWASVALVLVTLSAVAFATQVSYEERMRETLERATAEIIESGFEEVFERGGSLRENGHEDHAVLMSAGREYEIRGVCDSDCLDMDLTILDADGNVRTEDIDPDNLPRLSFSPEVSGTFTLQVHMYDCQLAPCYYAVLVARRVASVPESGPAKLELLLGQTRATLMERATIRDQHQ